MKEGNGDGNAANEQPYITRTQAAWGLNSRWWTAWNTQTGILLTQHNTHQTPPCCHRQKEDWLSLEVGDSKKVETVWGCNTTTLLCSTSGSPVDKAHRLECRSRTPRNTDGLVSLSALPLSDLRGEIKQEELPARVQAETDACFVLLKWESVTACLHIRGCARVPAVALRGVYFFICPPGCVCTCKCACE